MGLEANKEVVRQYFRALCEARMDDAAALIAKDVQWWSVPNGDMDINELKAIWARIFDGAPGVDAMKIVSMTAEDDRVAAELISEVPLPDGRDYRNNLFILFTIRDGQIAKAREHMDTAYVKTMIPGH